MKLKENFTLVLESELQGNTKVITIARDTERDIVIQVDGRSEIWINAEGKLREYGGAKYLHIHEKED